MSRGMARGRGGRGGRGGGPGRGRGRGASGGRGRGRGRGFGRGGGSSGRQRDSSPGGSASEDQTKKKLDIDEDVQGYFVGTASFDDHYDAQVKNKRRYTAGMMVLQKNGVEISQSIDFLIYACFHYCVKFMKHSNLLSLIFRIIETKISCH